MAWTRFPRRWLKPILALNAVLILYVISSFKTEPEASNISETFPRRDVDLHSMEFIPNTWLSLTNSKLYREWGWIKQPNVMAIHAQLKVAMHWFAHLLMFSLTLSVSSIVCNPRSTSQSLTMYLFLYHLFRFFFFYLSKLLISGFLRFKGSFVHGQINVPWLSFF